MDTLKIIISTIVSFIALFASSKLIGNKQMSQLNLFDYINGITIGSIAAEMATDLEQNPLHPFIAIIIYTSLVILCDYISKKSIRLRRFLSGRIIILMQNDKLFRQNFKKGRIELTEFMTACRVNGFFNLKDIQTAILEENGKISIMPKSTARPVNDYYLKIALKKETPDIVVISDGVILEKNLKQTGNNMNWLNNQMKNLGIKSEKDIFLAVCNTVENTLSAYRMNEDAPENDITQ